MTLYFKQEPLVLGGTNPRSWIACYALTYAELAAFNKNYHGHMPFVTPEQRDVLNLGPKPSVQQQMRAKDLQLALRIELRLNLPPRGLDMHRSKTQVRLLVPEKFREWLLVKEACPIPEKWAPVLNMHLKEQYSHYSGQGLTDEAAAYFRKELRGKLIDLLRSGQHLLHKEEPDGPHFQALEKLNAQFEKFDLGRRSDLNWHELPDEEAAEVSEKFTPGILKSVDTETPSRFVVPPSEFAATKPWLKD